MIKALAHLLLAIELGAGFGTASAELISTSSNAVEVDIRVEVTGSAESVVAHLVLDGEPSLVLPLVQRQPGVFGIRTELAPLNYRVVFEILGPDPAQSEQHSLMELGLEFPASGETTTTTVDSGEGISSDSMNWLWLAVAFGAAALSTLAFWVLGGETRQSSSDTDSTASGADDLA